MTAFSRTWNTAYESTPANSNNISEGAQRIREHKLDLRERLEVDHIFGTEAGATSNAGYHKFVTLVERGSDPTVPTDTGLLYTKDDTGITNLYFRSASGVQQLTAGAILKIFSLASTWTAGQVLAEYTITYGATIQPNLANGNAQIVTLTGNVQLNAPTGGAAGATLSIQFVQDATGSRTLTLGSGFTKAVGLDYTLSIAANSRDLVVLYKTSASWAIVSIAKAIGTAV